MRIPARDVERAWRRTEASCASEFNQYFEMFKDRFKLLVTSGASRGLKVPDARSE